MDIQEKYKEETGIKAYDTSKQKYKIDYVIWLENRIEQLPIHDVVDSKRRLEIWDNGYKQGYEDGQQGKQKHKDLGVY